MIQTSNRTVVDLRKVQYADFYYRNQNGLTCRVKPRKPTAHGIIVSADEKAFWHHYYPAESTLDRAKRLGILDVWTAKLKLQLTANHSLIYSGAKAMSIWREWNRRIYGKTS